MKNLLILITLFVAITLILNVLSYNYGYSSENQTAFRKGYTDGIEKGTLAGNNEGNQKGEIEGAAKAVLDHDKDYVYWKAEGFKQSKIYVDNCLHIGQLK